MKMDSLTEFWEKKEPIQDQIDDLIYELIRERKRQKISQTKLSLETGIPQATISRVESFSCNPTLSVLLKISNALGLSLSFHSIRSNI